MGFRVVVVAVCLLAFAMVPGTEAAPEPVGGCSSGATVEICSVQCIQPPCPVYVCINKGDPYCTRI